MRADGKWKEETHIVKQSGQGEERDEVVGGYFVASLSSSPFSSSFSSSFSQAHSLKRILAFWTILVLA